MFSRLNLAASPSVSIEMEVIESIPEDDGDDYADGDEIQLVPVASVSNTSYWKGGLVDHGLKALSAVSLSLGVVLTGVGHVMLNQSEESVQQAIGLMDNANMRIEQSISSDVEHHKAEIKRYLGSGSGGETMNQLLEKYNEMKDAKNALSANEQKVAKCEAVNDDTINIASSFADFDAKCKTYLDKRNEFADHIGTHLTENAGERQAMSSIDKAKALLYDSVIESDQARGFFMCGTGVFLLGVGVGATALRRYLTGASKKPTPDSEPVQSDPSSQV